MPRPTTVLATGVFDLIHPGHLRFLEESKKRGGAKAKLVVVVARDRTVEARKGRRPVMPESQRRDLVAALKPVDRAILGHEKVDFLETLREIRPDIVCVGHDQNDVKHAVDKIVKDENLQVRVLQIPKYGPRSLNSSTSIRKLVVSAWQRSKS